MNNIKRWSLGFVSTCFLAVGLVRAADMLDPINRDRSVMENGAALVAVDCVAMCNFADRATVDCVAMCNIAADLN